MLIEINGKSYISDKVEEGKVVAATRYVHFEGKYHRVGESVSVDTPYKEIYLHNVKARNTVKTLDLKEPVEPDQPVDKVVDSVEKTDEITNPEDWDPKEPAEPGEKYTFVQLKKLNRTQQCEIAKALGLKNYQNTKEDDRIEMILSAQ